MAVTKEEVLEKFCALCVPLGDVSGKSMFGGYGVFCDNVMFALITRQGALHLKTDDENRSRYEAINAEKHGKMPYYTVPNGALESWQALEPWARPALEAAKRAPRKTKKRK